MPKLREFPVFSLLIACTHGQYISGDMIDRFQVLRDAQKISESWGDLEFMFPHLKDTRFSPGAKVGVIIDATVDRQGPVKLKYGHMEFGFKETESLKKGIPFIYEDEILSGKKFQPLFMKRRCLVVVDRWVWHRRGNLGSKNWFAFHPIEKITMAFAGLYNSISHSNGTKRNSVAIIGLSSNEFYREYESDRMPAVFLPGPEAIKFLNPKLSESAALQYLRAWPIDQIIAEPCREYGEIGE